MKNVVIITTICLISAQLFGQNPFKLTPITLAGVSSISRIRLPDVAPFTIRTKKKTDSAHVSGIVTNATCACSAVLPVALFELTGFRLNNSQVVLNWRTENETNSTGFLIERSLDDGATFLPVGNMGPDTSNNTEKKYTETDMNGHAKTSFYRVKQMDLDGNFTFSNTINVNGYYMQQKVGLSPNPATNYTLVNCFSTSTGKGTVTVLSANGQRINETSWALFTGSNTLNLSLAKYAAGMYYVQMILPDGTKNVMKLVVE